MHKSKNVYQKSVEIMDAKDNTDTLIYRSSRPEVFCKGRVLEKFAKLTGKHLWPATLYQKRDSGTGVFL